MFFNVKLPDTPVTASTPTDATSGPFHAVAARRFHPVFVRELALHDNLQPRLAKRTGEDGGSKMLEKPSPMCDDRMYYGVISVPDSLFRYGQCGQAIAEYEAIQADRRRNSNGTTTEVPIKYDYVYALRPDIWMHGSVMLPHEIANNTLYTNMSPTGITAPFRQWYALAFPDDANNSAAVPDSGDKLLAGGREAFNVAMRAYTSVDTCDPYRFIAHLGPEMTLLRWMQVNKVGVDVMEKVAVSVARMSHVECFVVDALPESRVTEAWRTEARDMCVRASGLVGREREEDGEREANRE